MKFGTRGFFGIADYKSELNIQKFKMSDAISRTKMQKAKSYAANISLWQMEYFLWSSIAKSEHGMIFALFIEFFKWKLFSRNLFYKKQINSLSLLVLWENFQSNLWRPSTSITENILLRVETNVTLNIIFLKSVQKNELM